MQKKDRKSTIKKARRQLDEWKRNDESCENIKIVNYGIKEVEIKKSMQKRQNWKGLHKK